MLHIPNSTAKIMRNQMFKVNGCNINWLSEIFCNTYGIDGEKCKFQAKIDPP
jgi:hypothetical protein